MSNTVFAWRNWCSEVGQISLVYGSVYPETPLSNLLTPQTMRLAIAQGNILGYMVQFAGHDDSPPVGYPVDIIALLNHNIVGPIDHGNFQITLLDAHGQSYIFQEPELFKLSDGQFQSHLFWMVPRDDPGFDWDRVVHFVVSTSAPTGKINPITGEFTAEPFAHGGIWAGPVWRPDRGIRFGSFTFGITEARRGATSIGGQYYPLPQPRRRRLSGDFTLTAESETFSLPESGFGLQQMAAWCATSRPVICIPDITDPELVYTQGIYGYFDNDISWSHFDTSAKERQYRGSFSITEAL